MSVSKQTGKSLLASFLFSLAYMGILYGLHGYSRAPWYSIMSLGFLLLGPFATGALVNAFAHDEDRGNFENLVLLPVLYSVISLVLACLLKVEGRICVLMAAPVFVILSPLGACAHYLFVRNRKGPIRRAGLAGILMLPMIAGPIESHVGARSDFAITRDSILIDAPAGTVWKNIIRVPRIDPGELHPGLASAMGFPDPVAADLDREGLGGVRRASFRGNLVFTETIDRWEEGRALSFTIVPNTAEVPPSTLDEHMIVGGRYFNVLRGTYEIEARPDGKCLLKLSSEHVSTTDFNTYASLWGRLVMGDIQNRILQVIRARCESARI
jgi:hypothetical protein